MVYFNLIHFQKVCYLLTNFIIGRFFQSDFVTLCVALDKLIYDLTTNADIRRNYIMLNPVFSNSPIYLVGERKALTDCNVVISRLTSVNNMVSSLVLTYEERFNVINSKIFLVAIHNLRVAFVNNTYHKKFIESVVLCPSEFTQPTIFTSEVGGVAQNELEVVAVSQDDDNIDSVVEGVTINDFVSPDFGLKKRKLVEESNILNCVSQSTSNLSHKKKQKKRSNQDK